MKLKTRLEQRGEQTVFVINRKEWMRGRQDDDTVLWDGSRGCCLGLAAAVEGIPLGDLLGEAEPADIKRIAPTAYCSSWTRGADDLPRNSTCAHDAMTYNDEVWRDERREPERESAIADVFREARGWLVEFED